MFNIFLIFLFIRPFISSQAFPSLDFIYSSAFISFLVIFILFHRINWIKIKSALLPFLLFIFGVFISFCYSINQKNSIGYIYIYLTPLLLLFASTTFKKEECILIVRIISLSSIFISFLAIYQYFFGFQSLLNYLKKSGITDQFVFNYISQKRVFYPFMTPNALAGYLIMSIPLIYIDKTRKWFLIPVFIALFLTKSTGAFLSLFIGLIFYAYLLKKTSKKAWIAIMLLFIIFLTVIIMRQSSIQQNTTPLNSLIQRISYWSECINVIKTHPLTGTGIGNLSLTASRYAHNSFLQLWGEIGIVGIMGFLWLVILIIKTCIRKIKNASNDISRQNWALLITSCLIFLIHNLCDFTLMLPELNLIWWVILWLNVLQYDN